VLVTGPTGSGKSTTLASMIDMINRERAEHILTIEDPIEYIYTPIRSIIHLQYLWITVVQITIVAVIILEIITHRIKILVAVCKLVMIIPNLPNNKIQMVPLLAWY
jgi:energy-coupling factor transporter ATP-binding protein EcfA2